MDDALQRSYQGRQIASLALASVSTSDQAVSSMKAAVWHNRLIKLGVQLPLFVIRDLGVLLSTSRDTVTIAPRPMLRALSLSKEQNEATAAYATLLREVAESTVIERLAQMHLRDDVIAALLVKILSDANDRWAAAGRTPDADNIAVEGAAFEGLDYKKLWQEYDPGVWFVFLGLLGELRLHVLTAVELINVETVRVLGMFRGDTTLGSEGDNVALESVDMLAALDSPDAHDVASFSLELLPSVLETKRSAGVQSLSIDGYASVERKGRIDSLVLSELAYDEDIFLQKYIEAELLYYGHERQHDDERVVHYVLVDSSPSMRGRRQLFARGLALALIKKLLLLGEDVRFRFFDARLHPCQRIGRGSNVPVSYMLSFRSDFGRNYGYVFQQLVRHVQKLRREQKRQVVMYFLTHGQCHADPNLVRKLSADAQLYGVFVLPSEERLPEFVESLDSVQVISPKTFDSLESQRERALEIVNDVAQKVELV